MKLPDTGQEMVEGERERAESEGEKIWQLKYDISASSGMRRGRGEDIDPIPQPLILLEKVSNIMS